MRRLHALASSAAVTVMLLFARSSAAESDSVFGQHRSQIELMRSDDHDLTVHSIQRDGIGTEEIDLSGGFSLSKDSVLFAGVDLVRSDLDTKNPGLPSVLGKGAVPLGFGQFVGDTFIAAGVAPGLAFDEDEGPNLNKMQFDGEAMGYYFVNEHWDLQAGVGVVDLGHSDVVYPLVGTDLFAFDGKLHVNARLPDDLKISWRVTDKTTSYVAAAFDEDRYRLRDRPKTISRSAHTGIGVEYAFSRWGRLGLEGGGAYTHLARDGAYQSFPFQLYGDAFLGVSF